MKNHKGLDGYRAFQKVWANRNMVVQRKFDVINAFLESRRAVNINAEIYTAIHAQWLEYAAVTDRQIDILNDIIERFKL